MGRHQFCLQGDLPKLYPFINISVQGQVCPGSKIQSDAAKNSRSPLTFSVPPYGHGNITVEKRTLWQSVHNPIRMPPGHVFRQVVRAACAYFGMNFY